MRFFIRKIFEEKIDESVHLQFQKFSKGNFKNRAVVKVKNSKGKYNLGTTPEYANELVRAVAEILGTGKTKVTGVVISTSDLSEKFDFKDKKQFQGVKKYIIDKEMSGTEIIALCDGFPESFISLSFKVKETELKIKAKAPKSGKPSSKNEDSPKADFCKLKSEKKEIIEALVFEKLDFKEATIIHEFVIEDIEIPQGVSNPSELRKLAKRKGKIIRKAVIDGKEMISEKNFVA